jgi:WD40 repeat protein
MMGMAKEYKYSAFISYSRQDRKFAVRLENDLERYVLPKAQELLGEKGRRRPFPDVFRDESRLVPGADLPARIRFGLENSEFLIVVCSPAAVKSEWVEKEIVDFISLGGETRILAVVVDGEPNAAKNNKPIEGEALPRPLRLAVTDGVSTDVPCTEPLWVDWRGQKQGDRLNFLGLVAALLGLKDLDELIRRDQERERQARRRLRQIVGGITVLAAVTLIAAIGAFEQRQKSLEIQSMYLARQAEKLPTGDPGKLLLALEAMPSVQGALFPRRNVGLADQALITAASSIRLLGIVHSEPDILGPAFSPDGRNFVTTFRDEVRQWNVRTGAPGCSPKIYDGLPVTVAFSPKGDSFATVSSAFHSKDDNFTTTYTDDVVEVWNASTCTPIGMPMKHMRAVRSIRFSPDGGRIVTGSEDKTARLWNARTGAPMGAPMKHDADVIEAVFSPDGNRIVTGSEDQTAHLWDAHSGAPLGQPMKNDAPVSQAAFSSDGNYVVTTSDKGARVWDGHTGVLLCGPIKQEYAANSANFSPDGSRIVTTSGEIAQLWDAHTCIPLGIPMKHDKEHVINGVAFSPDGNRLVTASSDNTIRLWDGYTGDPLSAPLRHDAVVSSAAFSRDGNRIVTATKDGTIMRWDVNTIVPLTRQIKHKHIFLSAVFSPDGGRIVTANSDYGMSIHNPPPDSFTAQLWDARTGSPLGVPMMHKFWVISAQFSPDGRRVVTGSSDGTAHLWDAYTGAPLGQPMKHDGRVQSAVFSPDGKRIVTSSLVMSSGLMGKISVMWPSDGNRCRFWDAYTGEASGPVVKQRSCISFAVFSPDGSRIAADSSSHLVRLWNAYTGVPVGNPMKHTGVVRRAAFSPDGRRIVTVSDEHSAHLWDAQTGSPLGQPMKHDGNVRYAAFSPDGSRIVTTSEDETIRLWDAHTGAPLWAMKDEGGATSAAFSPNGRVILTASYRATRLWDAQTGAQLDFPTEQDGSGNIAAFSPDGSRILTGSALTLRLWGGARSPLTGSTGELIEQACALLPSGARNFSATPSLRATAQIAFLDPDAPGPCDRYGLLSHHYWFGLAGDVWKAIRNWSNSACVSAKLCKRQTVLAGQAGN